MSALLDAGVLQVLIVAFGVGIVVGLTGMGGGALMTPALIFLGIPPSSAVANDLVAAAFNKSAGAAIHIRHGSPNRTMAKWLVFGSVPMALLGSWLVSAIGDSADREGFLKIAIGCALLLTAATYATRMYFELAHSIRDDADAADPKLRPLPTLVIGAVGGLLVGLTSVGSGSLIMVSLLLLYPALSAVRLVGTDLLQAIPLVIAAAIGHVLSAGVDWSVLIPLVIGGTPGTLLGAQLASVVSQSIVRRGIVMVLSLTGLGMLKVPPVWVGMLGAAMVILGPVVWGLLRQLHGSAPFEHLALPAGNRSSKANKKN